jgi:hypothetical protein
MTSSPLFIVFKGEFYILSTYFKRLFYTLLRERVLHTSLYYYILYL